MNRQSMKLWVADTIARPKKAALPVLSFPCVQLMGITVKELISAADMQAKGLKMIADRTPMAASVSLMDLSVEAEAFGSAIRVSDDEVPTVIGAIVSDEEEAGALRVPKVGDGRTGINVDGIRKAAELIQDRPVFAGVIGPFSLAGRLMDVSEALVYCYDEPDMVHTVMKKATAFLIDYCNAYKAAGANGVLLAEPLTGLLSPALAREFSHPYVKELIDAVQDDSFALFYHNCGNTVPQMAQDIYQLGAMGCHFGNCIDMADVMDAAPAGVLVMGNVDPAGELRNGTPDSVRAATRRVMERCCRYPNFLISSGCDIPPLTPWENLDAFFGAVEDFYASH